jgi:mRNA interferase RelE/StbE
VKTVFRRSFARDLRKLKDQAVHRRIRDLILSVEQADSPADIAALKKLQGSKNYYRIRIGDYRIGVTIEQDVVTFVRVLHRKEIYRYFP